MFAPRYSMQGLSLLVVVCLIGLSGCAMTPSEAQYRKVKKEHISHSLNKRDYKWAYSSLEDLYNAGSEQAQAEARGQVSLHPELIEHADIYLRERFNTTATIYKTYDEFEASIVNTIDTYETLAPVSDKPMARNLAREVFDESRSKYPARYPVDKVFVDQTKEEFLEVIPKTPERVVPVRIPSTPPTDFVVNEYSFYLPPEFKVSGSQPMWIAFRDDKVVRVGFGNVKHAIVEGYGWYLSEDLAAGRIKQAAALRLYYQKYQEAYGQPNPITQEYMTYLILVSEKLDSGAITQTEADYQLAQKQSELATRLSAIKQQQAEAAKQEEQLRLQKQQLAAQRQAQDQAAQIARSQMMMQMGLGILQYNQNQQLINTIRNQQPPTYTIRPAGGNTWRATPY